MWLTYKYIRDNKLTDKVHILLNVHDQLTTACTEDLGEWWKDKLDELMCQAAKKVIPSGLLKAETNISTVWTK
jgi:DNA polymerase I-like protein with 3'-5' exonuclease and polymerase domains